MPFALTALRRESATYNVDWLRLLRFTRSVIDAHHLRELKALIEIEKEPWAKKMFDALLWFNKAVHRAKNEKRINLPTRLRRRIVEVYDAIVESGFAFHKNQPPLAQNKTRRGKKAHRPGENLLIRLRDRKADVLRFVFDFNVPFTNNQAEQDIRMMKVKMKISGGFRSVAGAQAFVDLRSVISTARKQRLNILKTLINPFTILGAVINL